MNIEIKTAVPLVAKVIDEYYDDLQPAGKYPVERIEMGQAYTSVFLERRKNVYNSIHFKFYIGDREVDIYSSGFFNHYRMQNLPGIKFVEQEEGTEIRQQRNLKIIVNTYGADPQIDMMIEESSELITENSKLIKALLKCRRKSNSDSSTGEEMTTLRDAIIDEIADVKIMLAQMEILFGCSDEVGAQIERKIERQMDRLTKGKNKKKGGENCE